MAKRVRAAEALGVRINTTQLKILREMSLLAAGGAARVSKGALATAIGTCRATVSTSARSLVAQGLVTIEYRYLANGGQLENGYVVTELGERVLKAAEAPSVAS